MPSGQCHRLCQGDIANVPMTAPGGDDGTGRGTAKGCYAAAALQVPLARPSAWRTEETRPPFGILSSADRELSSADREPRVHVSCRVDGIAAAAGQVRAADGRGAIFYL